MTAMPQARIEQPDMQASDMTALLERQRAAFRAEPDPPRAIRDDRLKRLAALVKDGRARLAAAIAQDFGHRSAHETLLLEAGPALAAIRHARGHLKAWMRPQRRASALEFLSVRNRVQYQPLGVVGILSPWNYPLFLALGPLVDVLAAGNRALLKPSEFTPAFNAALAEAVAARFAPEEVALVQGGVAEAEAFSRLPFDHLVFTGSTAVGRRVMAAAAPNLTPVTLELGGKCPVVLDGTWPLARAARDIAIGKLLNAGQTCIAPDYVLAPRAALRPLAEAILAEIRAMYPNGAQDDGYTSVITAQHAGRLEGMVAEARDAGAEVLEAFAGDAAARRLAPAIVIDPPRDARLMREEIFGPILPLIPCETAAEAADVIAAGDRPLALYVLSRDRGFREAVLGRTQSGGVTLNGTILHVAQTDLPFGGVGASGIGAYHGIEGFRRFSHARAIAEPLGPVNPMHLARPPFGMIARLLERVFIGG